MNILLAIKNRDLALTLKNVLEKNNFNVELLYDGVQAYQRITTGERLDLAVIEEDISRLNALNLSKNLRNKFYIIPLIMIASSNSKKENLLISESGIDEYLFHPFNALLLVELINDVIKNKITFKNNNLSLNEQQILSANSNCKLTYLESLILTRLIKRETLDLAFKYHDLTLESAPYIFSLNIKLAKINSGYHISLKDKGYTLTHLFNK